MKKIAFFCIPAHGHTNPMLPVASELVKRGNEVYFYSFDEFKEKISKTGAKFISCNQFLSKLSKKEETALKNVSTTEMTIQDIKATLKMDKFIDEEFKEFKPDIIYTDSVCFWGKLNALKYKIPIVVSTSTFAFNRLSSQYMKHSLKELADLILGLPRVNKELKKLQAFGYPAKSIISLVQSDNKTDSIVYTSKYFQPYSESFSDHYLFMGPSLFSKAIPKKTKNRPLIYVSMGTVINDRPDFYNNCIEAFKNSNTDVIISCGNEVDPKSFKNLPENIKIHQYVDQLEILSKADVFITHCGMNSVSESLYMATPMVLYPQTGEQKAVAKRVREINAGTLLKNNSPMKIYETVEKILNDPLYSKSAEKCSIDFRQSPGVTQAAKFIENAPHTTNKKDIMETLTKINIKFQIFYWLIVSIFIVLFGIFITWKFVWIISLIAGLFSNALGNILQKFYYKKLIKHK